MIKPYNLAKLYMSILLSVMVGMAAISAFIIKASSDNCARLVHERADMTAKSYAETIGLAIGNQPFPQNVDKDDRLFKVKNSILSDKEKVAGFQVFEKDKLIYTSSDNFQNTIEGKAIVKSLVHEYNFVLHINDPNKKYKAIFVRKFVFYFIMISIFCIFIAYALLKSLNKIIRSWNKIMHLIGAAESQQKLLEVSDNKFFGKFFNNIAKKMKDMITPSGVDPIRSRLLSYMTHELRTPLNAIIGFSEILMEEYAENTQEQNLSMIQKIRFSAKRLFGMVQNMLEITAFEAGVTKVVLEYFDMKALLEDVLHENNIVLKEQNNSNVVHFPKTPVQIYSDKVKLRNAVNNVINNAAKFTYNGEIIITLEEDPNDKIYILKIRDNGVGMSRAEIKAALNPKSQEEGSGFGLIMTNKYCNLLSIKLIIDSIKGVGTTVTFLIPKHHYNKN